MNTTAIPVPELICQLLDAADGIPADVAAAGLVISHGHFQHRDAFRRTITTGPASAPASRSPRSAGMLPCARWTPG
ncbi:MAG: hypothetical protein JO345_16645 [Streptosporangiaceae bacterium]|nr:hypothetical protein [Streptosporangiaceae bacterium]